MRKLIACLLMVTFLVLPLMAGEYQKESAEFEKAFAAGNYAGAVKLATTTVGKGNALNAQGMELYEAGDFSGAAYLFREAIVSDPEQLWAHNNLGAVLLYFGKVSEAISCFDMSVLVNSAVNDAGAAERVSKAKANAAYARSL